MAVSGEYGTGMIRITLAATPRRLTVLAAKAAVLTGMILGTGAIAVLGSLLAGGLILPGHGIGPSHGYPAISASDGPVLRAAFGSVLYLALIALLSLGAAIGKGPGPGRNERQVCNPPRAFFPQGSFVSIHALCSEIASASDIRSLSTK
jgi:hypothetical protein